LDSDSSKTIALLGLSQIQLAIATDAIRERFPDYRVVQLAMGARGPVATLADLADDARWRRIVICSANELYLHRDHWADQQEYVDYYHRKSTLDRRLNRLVDCFVQSRLVLVHPRVSFLNTLAGLARDGRFPEMEYLVTHYDRSISADYRAIPDLATLRAQAIENSRRLYAAVGETADWLEDLGAIELSVRRIQSRGGRVVFVRLVSTDESYELSERYFPKTDFWDRFAAETEAVAIHFRDVPTLAGFDCPDTLHLDYRDTGRFTHALVDELVRRGVLPN
jgi:hypothetical protein